MKNNTISSIFRNVIKYAMLFIAGIFFLGTVGSIMLIATAFVFFTTGKNPFAELPDPVMRGRNCY